MCKLQNADQNSSSHEQKVPPKNFGKHFLNGKHLTPPPLNGTATALTYFFPVGGVWGGGLPNLDNNDIANYLPL